MYYRETVTKSGHKISAKHRGFNCAVLPQVISVKAAAQEKLWRFHVKNGVCLTGRADPKRSLTDKNDRTRPPKGGTGFVL